MTDVYIAGDTGPSGFGVAMKSLVRHLMDHEDFRLTVKTHFWGFNREGIAYDGNRSFPDTRFKEHVLTSDRLNKEHLIEDVREFPDRTDVNLTENLDSNTTVNPKECLIREFEGKEDIWFSAGGMGFAEQSPQDDQIHTIVSTDFNLDTIPRDWPLYMEKVDEVWVPSQWTYDAFKNSLEENHSDLLEKVRVMPYGIDMRYKPTRYDCTACPNQHKTRNPGQQQCLNDDKFNFLIVSRFYHIKGVYRTIKAFIEEFRGNEPVRLFFKTTSNQQFQFNPIQSVQTVVNELGYPDPPEIGMKVQPFTTQKMYDLFGHADAFVQASRAECFGIAQLQAAYCGTPVIYTNWSSQRELIDADNPGFIPINDYEVERPQPESQAFMYSGSDDYPIDSHWATPSIDAIGNRMRQVYEMSETDRQQAGCDASEYVKQNFQWEDMVQPRIKRFREAAK